MTFSIKDTDDFTKSRYWSLSTTVQVVLKCWYHFLSLARNSIVLGIKFFVERRPELIRDDQNPHTPSERDAKILFQGLHVYTLIRSSGKRPFLPPWHLKQGSLWEIGLLLRTGEAGLKNPDNSVTFLSQVYWPGTEHPTLKPILSQFKPSQLSGADSFSWSKQFVF